MTGFDNPKFDNPKLRANAVGGALAAMRAIRVQ
jgi:hypothetical protein